MAGEDLGDGPGWGGDMIPACGAADGNEWGSPGSWLGVSDKSLPPSVLPCPFSLSCLRQAQSTHFWTENMPFL